MWDSNICYKFERRSDFPRIVGTCSQQVEVEEGSGIVVEEVGLDRVVIELEGKRDTAQEVEPDRVVIVLKGRGGTVQEVVWWLHFSFSARAIL
jgi:hypothetical protein